VGSKKKTNGEVFAETQAAVTAAFGTPRPVSVRELLDNLRSCSTATLESGKKGTKRNLEHEKRCYRDVFQQVVGRKPTAAEINHMVGGIELRSETA
jgi:hypothetical protein